MVLTDNYQLKGPLHQFLTKQLPSVQQKNPGLYVFYGYNLIKTYIWVSIFIFQTNTTHKKK